MNKWRLLVFLLFSQCKIATEEHQTLSYARIFINKLKTRIFG